MIDQALQTITVVDNSNPAGGTVTSFYRYSVVPEPGTGALLRLGITRRGDGR